MKSRKWSDNAIVKILSFMVAFLILFGIAYYAGAWIRDTFFQPANRPIFWIIWLYSSFSMLLSASWSLAIEFLSGVQSMIFDKFAPCAHGIRGGEKRGLCEPCRKEKEQRQADSEKQRLGSEAKKKIADLAADLMRNERQRLAASGTHRLDFLLSQSPAGFESLVAHMYCLFGYETHVTPESNDAGKDIILMKDGKKYLVECKRYGKDNLVGRPDIQKLHSAVVTEKADGGHFVTTSSYSRQALDYGKKADIDLIGGSELVELMAKAFPSSSEDRLYRVMCRDCGKILEFDLTQQRKKGTCPGCGQSIINDLLSIPLSYADATGEALCPKCGGRMRMINGRRGAFYGCRRYPNCRGTRSIKRSRSRALS